MWRLTLERTRPVANSTTDGTPTPTPAVSAARTELTAETTSSTSSPAFEASVGRMADSLSRSW